MMIGAKQTRMPRHILTIIGGLLLLAWSFSQAAPVVSIEPAVTIVDPNDLFELAVRIDAGVDTISNFQVIFDYDVSVIEFQEAIEGSLYTLSGNQTWFYFSESPPGTVEVFDVIFPAMSFVLPPGELTRLRFRAVADGVTEIRIFSIDVQDILRNSLTDVSTRNGTVCVGDASTGVGRGERDGRRWEIGYPFPNPSRNETRVRLIPPPAGHRSPIRVGMYDVAGRLVRELLPVPALSPGELIWDGRDGRGAPVAAGVYFFRLDTEIESVTRKVILVR